MGPDLLREQEALIDAYCALTAHIAHDKAPRSAAAINNAVVDSQFMSDSRDSGESIVDILIRLAVSPALTLQSFVFVAEALRIVLVDTHQYRHKCAAAVAADFIREALGVHADPLPARIGAVVARLHEGSVDHVRNERELASELGMNPAYLGRLLRKYTGLSFYEWRWRAMARRAAARLLEGDEQIAQIAYRLGYEHASQFDRDFARVFGITPRVFRRQCGGSSVEVKAVETDARAVLSPKTRLKAGVADK